MPIDQGRTIFAARRVGDQVSLTLDNATKRFDHVLLATGYRIDVDKMSMLEPKLREKIVRHGGLPVLNGGLESSVPGLHFVGAAAVAQLRAAAALHRRRRICGAARHPRGAARRSRAPPISRPGTFAEPAAISFAAEREHP